MQGEDSNSERSSLSRSEAPGSSVAFPGEISFSDFCEPGARPDYSCCLCAFENLVALGVVVREPLMNQVILDHFVFQVSDLRATELQPPTPSSASSFFQPSNSSLKPFTVTRSAR